MPFQGLSYHNSSLLPPERAPKNITITADGSNSSDSHQKLLPVEMKFYDDRNNFIKTIEARITARSGGQTVPNHSDATIGTNGSISRAGDGTTPPQNGAHDIGQYEASSPAGPKTNFSPSSITNHQLQNRSMIVLGVINSILIQNGKAEDQTSQLPNQSSKVEPPTKVKMNEGIINQTLVF